MPSNFNSGYCEFCGTIVTASSPHPIELGNIVFHAHCFREAIHSLVKVIEWKKRGETQGLGKMAGLRETDGAAFTPKPAPEKVEFGYEEMPREIEKRYVIIRDPNDGAYQHHSPKRTFTSFEQATTVAKKMCLQHK